MKILIFICCILFINWLLMALYCRFQKKIDNKKFARIDMQRNRSDSKDNEGVHSPKSIAKKLYHWLNSYVYGWVRYNILITGHVPSYRIRKLLYWAVFGMKITKKTVIFGGCEFRSPWNITLGNCTIGANCILDGRGRISVEDDVVFGSGVHIWTMQHSINDPYFRTLDENIAQVVVKRHAWIASDSMIQPGITIGEGTVLASQAVAVKNCDSFGVYAGIPAVKVADRNTDLRYVHDGKVSWHFM